MDQEQFDRIQKLLTTGGFEAANSHILFLILQRLEELIEAVERLDRHDK